MRLPSAFALAAMLAACSEGPSAMHDEFGLSLIDDLVQRFDVPACTGAQLGKAGLNPDERKPGRKTVYLVDDECIANMQQAFRIIGFAQNEGMTYRYTSEQGWYELVQLTRTDDGQTPVIIWETINP